jgi:hypothetical protein
MYDTSDVEAIGIILDLSLRYSSNGKTNVDNVKQSLIDFFRKNLDEDDVVYLYHPEIIQTENHVGAHVAAVSNYKTDGWKFDLMAALQQTLFIVASEPCEDRTLVLVTDRLSETKVLSKIASINQKSDLQCKIICVDIGSHLPEVESVEMFHFLDSAQLIVFDSFKEIIHGTDFIRPSSGNPQ